MITFDLNNPFKFTVKDQNGSEKELSGTFRELTKKEQHDFKVKNEAIEKTVKKAQSIIDKLKRNVKMIEIKEKTEDWAGVESLTVENFQLEDDLIKITDKFDVEEERKAIMKTRFVLCLGGENRDEIIELAETYGYEELMSVVAKAVVEGKQI